MILVFGKTGQLGFELDKYDQTVNLNRDEADLKNPILCANLIQELKPSAVINAAAFTAVESAEVNEKEATLINGITPTFMAQRCAEQAIPFLFISTDYVFDGSGDNERDPATKTSPLNAYGRSKAIGEQGVRDSGCDYAILRVSWVFSQSKTNFVSSILTAAKEKRSLQVVEDQIGGPTPAPSLALACMKICDQLIRDPKKSGIYHYCGTPSLSWFEFACEIIQLAGLDVSIERIETKSYPQRARRPLNSRLNCQLVKEVFGIEQPDWRQYLSKILKESGGKALE